MRPCGSDAEVIADNEPRAVAVGQNDQTACFRDASDDLELLLVEDTEAAGFEDNGIHHLTDGVDVIATLRELLRAVLSCFSLSTLRQSRAASVRSASNFIDRASFQIRVGVRRARPRGAAPEKAAAAVPAL